MSNSLDLDQARNCVGPDLGPNCLHTLSADNTRRPKELDIKCENIASHRIENKFVNKKGGNQIKSWCQYRDLSFGKAEK